MWLWILLLLILNFFLVYDVTSLLVYANAGDV